ncbi:MAG: MBL fold metallo-hydrolase [Chloroflexota bacterium]
MNQSGSPDALQIERFVGGPLFTACYALIVPDREAILIDAARDAWRSALDTIDNAGATLTLVIATHGHWDHIAGMAELQRAGYEIAGHPGDKQWFSDPMGDREDLPFIIEPVTLDREVSDGDRLDIAGVAAQVLHTPGHSDGSISIWLQDHDAVFTGDTVLKGGAGYLDRPKSDARALAASVRRIAQLPESTTIYPGHGAPTTVGAEAWLEEAENADQLIADWEAGKGRWTPKSATA